MATVYAAMEDTLLVVSGAPEAPETARELAGYDLQRVAVHPDRPGRAFCGTLDSGLYRTTDGEWERVPVEGMADRVMAVAVDPADPDVVYAGTEPSAVHRSADGGDTWTHLTGLTDLPSASEWAFPPRPHTHHVRWVEVDPDDSDHLYVSIEAGALVQSHDGGDTWEDRVPGSRRDNHSLTTRADAPGVVWAAAGDGYAESHDGGDTWTHPQDGLDHRYCWSVATDGEVVLLAAASGPRRAHSPGSAESYVYRRRGDGAWERCDADLPAGSGMVRAELAAGGRTGEFYALSNRGLHHTTDAGDTWRALDVAWPGRFTRQTPNGLRVV
ncbi:MAG: WD40/YVTN/BNR-like repeat-containing protein [Haloarculaceae archaeon]